MSYRAGSGEERVDRRDKEKEEEEVQEERRKPPSGEMAHEPMVRRNNKDLGYTAGEAARPAVR